MNDLSLVFSLAFNLVILIIIKESLQIILYVLWALVRWLGGIVKINSNLTLAWRLLQGKVKSARHCSIISSILSFILALSFLSVVLIIFPRYGLSLALSNELFIEISIRLHGGGIKDLLSRWAPIWVKLQHSAEKALAVI